MTGATPLKSYEDEGVGGLLVALLLPSLKVLCSLVANCLNEMLQPQAVALPPTTNYRIEKRYFAAKKCFVRHGFCCRPLLVGRHPQQQKQRAKLGNTEWEQWEAKAKGVAGGASK